MSHPEAYVKILYHDRHANVREATVEVHADEAADEDYRRLLLGERVVEAIRGFGLLPTVTHDVHEPAETRGRRGRDT